MFRPAAERKALREMMAMNKSGSARTEGLTLQEIQARKSKLRVCCCLQFVVFVFGKGGAEVVWFGPLCDGCECLLCTGVGVGIRRPVLSVPEAACTGAAEEAASVSGSGGCIGVWSPPEERSLQPNRHAILVAANRNTGCGQEVCGGLLVKLVCVCFCVCVCVFMYICMYVYTFVCVYPPSSPVLAGRN